jgi:hypothetical protein
MLVICLGAELPLFMGGPLLAADRPAPGTLGRLIFDGQSLDGWKNSDFGNGGTVEVREGQLVLGTSDGCNGVTYTREFPRIDYEVALEAMRVEGTDFFCGMTFPVGDAPCSLIVGGWGGGVVGLSSIDGFDASENDTTRYREFESGKWYRVRLRVTAQRITAWIGEEQIVDVETEGKSFSVRPEVLRSRPFGLCSWQTTAAIRDVRVRSLAAQWAVLAPDTWDEFASVGKEADAIYGDLILRNGRITACIGRPVEGRNANMTVRNVGGSVVDLTLRDRPNDQLSAYFPAGQRRRLRFVALEWDQKSENDWSRLTSAEAASGSLVARFESDAEPNEPRIDVRYELDSDDEALSIETTYENTSSASLEVGPLDEVRADGGFEKASNGSNDLFWVYDKWWEQAYGVFSTTHPGLDCASDTRFSSLKFLQDSSPKATLQPGQKLQVRRLVFPAEHLVELKAVHARLSGRALRPFEVSVKDAAGAVVPFAEVVVKGSDGNYGTGRTGSDGRLASSLPPGDYRIEVSALARGRVEKPVQAGSRLSVELPVAGWVEAAIVNEGGGPTPCKVQFLGRNGTADPDFFPQTGEHAVRNVYYSHNGSFRQILPAGEYEVIISYGPEHDAVFTSITVRAGEGAPLGATVVRSVQTPGWISTDFHNHSSPSGDNTSSQLGRVLNLLCEHVEFAPCTEHNRLSTYVPHLEGLDAMHLMATCTGIELTNNPGDVNHQNSFPLLLKPRTQDGGGPRNDSDPKVQIERLALWDGESEKLVQQNHPDLGRVFFDKNADGTPDGGFERSIPYIDVTEVHPLSTIFDPPVFQSGGRLQNNRIVNWLAILNQGHRIPGVVNTDSHYTFHESGFLRNYVRSPTDDPARITTLDVVHAAERGRLIMTSGPYLEVTLRANGPSGQVTAIPGDEVAVRSGVGELSIRVQCPNWFDIDRVQVLVNSRAEPLLNFTRESHRDRFQNGVVKFDQTVPVEWKHDSHLIVVAAGEKSTLGPVLGPTWGKTPPIAVSNPIYVDVDGSGFKANGDTLGSPLPVAGNRPLP